MQAHWRPDAITRTGVIEPMWIRQVSPVDMARHTIDPFINSVRGPGPAVSPYPSPEDVAYAAGRVAKEFRAGRSAKIAIGTDKVKMKRGDAFGGIAGVIAQAATRLADGGTVAIEIGGRRIIVCCAGPNGEVSIKAADGASEMSVRETPFAMTSKGSNPNSGFGIAEGKYMDYLRPTGPGRIFNSYRIGTNDSPYHATMMNSVRTFATQAAAQTHAADRDALMLQRTQPAAALASRPPMPAPYFNHATQGQPFRSQHAHSEQSVRPTPFAMRKR